MVIDYGSNKNMDEFSKQVRFVCKNNINTEQELMDYQKSTCEKINPLKSKRENIWKKHKKASIENQSIEISKKITLLAEEIKYCNNIELKIRKHQTI